MSGILVTGGAGFIGSHLVERFLDRGEQVLVLDDFNDYYSPALKRHNISQVLDHPGYTLVEGDIRDLDGLCELLALHRIDRVVHLAARAGVRSSLQSPMLYEDVNARGTLTVLEACRSAGVRALVVASSSSVYGNSSRALFREDEAADRPISPYAATKRSAELLCHTYHHLYGMPVACLRFFTVYGPRQRPDMGFHTFARQIVSGESIRMFGDGSTRRDYTFVSDIVDGLVSVLDHVVGFEIVNLGNSRTVALSRVLEIFQEAMGRKARIERYPEQPGDVRLTCADISKAARLYGYAPKVDVEEGIARFVAWYLEVREAGVL